MLFLLLVSVLLVHAAGAQTPQAAFEVATIKAAPDADPATGSWSPPGIGRFTATHLSLARLLQLAYGIDDSQIGSKPAWLETTYYDVAAKPEEGVSLTRDELKPRLQVLLRQRFHLVTHWETRMAHGYALVVAKGGPHLTSTKGDHFPGFRVNVSPGHMQGLNWSMPILAKYLTSATGFAVKDATGIPGSFDVSFTYDPAREGEGSDSAELPLTTALTNATGLTLKPQKVPVQTLVIDAADPVPADN